MARLLIESGQRGISLDEGARTAKVVLISAGIGNLRDKNLYLDDAIASAVKVFEGAQCFLDHPSTIDEESRPERSVRDLCGWFSNCNLGTVRDPHTGDALAACYATLNFAESAPGELALGQVRSALRYAKQFPNSKDVFAGISINAGGMSEPAEVEGLGAVNAVVEITDVFSADIVTKPARGGKFLALSESFKSPDRPTRTRRRLVQAELVNPDGTEFNLPSGRSSGYIDEDGVAHVDEPEELDADDIPIASVRDDLERKRSIRRSMGKPDDEEADLPDVSKRAPDTDAWQTSEEGEVPPGILSGDPIMDPQAEGPAKRKRTSEAVRAFEASVGDGMADSSSWTSPEVVSDEKKLDPASPDVNLRYSVAVTEGKACGYCRHFQPGDPSNPADGGGCAIVAGTVRFVDICNKFAPKDAAARTFDSVYGED